METGLPKDVGTAGVVGIRQKEGPPVGKAQIKAGRQHPTTKG